MRIRQPKDPRKLQELYVDKRKRALHKRDNQKIDAVRAKLEAFIDKDNIRQDWLQVYRKISASLQSAPLTINIPAGRWFAGSNTYTTYQQTYERAPRQPGATGKGGGIMMQDDRLNPADTRMKADDQITFPESWGKAHKFSQRRAIWKSMNATGASTSKSGEMKDGKTIQQLGGSSSFVPGGSNPRTFTSTNPNFDPKSKQVFAALNYGRRIHGACVDYGYSHLVLKPELKIRALYYPTDTFYLAALDKVGLKGQESFETVGAIVQYRKGVYESSFFDACYYNKLLGDNSKGEDLIEAHLFQEVVLNRDVEELCLSRMDKGADGKTPFADSEWQTVLANARVWCADNNVRLMQVP